MNQQSRRYDARTPSCTADSIVAKASGNAELRAHSRAFVHLRSPANLRFIFACRAFPVRVSSLTSASKLLGHTHGPLHSGNRLRLVRRWCHRPLCAVSSRVSSDFPRKTRLPPSIQQVEHHHYVDQDAKQADVRPQTVNWYHATAPGVERYHRYLSVLTRWWVI